MHFVGSSLELYDDHVLMDTTLSFMFRVRYRLCCLYGLGGASHTLLGILRASEYTAPSAYAFSARATFQLQMWGLIGHGTWSLFSAHL